MILSLVLKAQSLLPAPPICTFYPSPPHPSLLPLISPLTQGVPSALAYTHSHKLLKRFKVCLTLLLQFLQPAQRVHLCEVVYIFYY